MQIFPTTSKQLSVALGRTLRDPRFLTELYWYTCVIELGSFSAAAEQAGVAKSSLSRRLKNLESRLGVQLLSRSTRKFVMTTIGEEVYRHALGMLAAAHEAQVSAEETLDQPAGLVRVAIPSILSSVLLDLFNTFKLRYPSVRYELYYQNDLASQPNVHLDLSLTIQSPPDNSSDVVVRPVTELRQAFFATPSLANQLKHHSQIAEIPDRYLLAYGESFTPEKLQLQNGIRLLKKPAMTSSNMQTLKDAAKAGLGAACLPLISCTQEIKNNELQTICDSSIPLPLQLSSETPSFRGITQTTRRLIEFINSELNCCVD